MAFIDAGPWPEYTYVVPHLYSKVNVRLVGVGTYIPKGLITNDFYAAIATRLGNPKTGDDLERVTGLETRHVRTSTLTLCRRMVGVDAPGLFEDPSAPREETLVDMAFIAAQRALASAGRSASEVDLIVGASSSDNDAFPTIANHLQWRLGLPPIRTNVLKGACACQTEAFQVAAEALSMGTTRLALVVAAEALLPNIVHVLDWKTSSLFGEGAAAFLLERGGEEGYLISGSDGSQAQSLFYQTPLRKDMIEMVEVDMKIIQLYQEGRGDELARLLSQYMVGYTKMNGKEVYREAPRAMAECIDSLRRHARLDYEQLAYVIPHQANSRITRRLGDLLIHDYGWPESTSSRLVDNFRYHGNTSNASIGMALSSLIEQRRIQEGAWLALAAVGGGMSYGCWLLRYHAVKHPEAISQSL